MAKNDEIVVHGATIKCTMGDKSATLKVASQSKYKIDGKKVATLMDFIPGANYLPLATFGTCKPFKAVPPPGSLCTPIPAGSWINAFSKKKVGGKTVLKGDACLMCTRGGGKISIEKSGQSKEKAKNNSDIKCKIDGCNKNGNHDLSSKPIGNHNGNSQILANNILKKYYGGIDQKSHPLSGKVARTTAQAHHLICCEAMRGDDDWSRICSTFGYNIDNSKNGILLPSSLEIACDLNIPLHRGNHNDVLIEGIKRKYLNAVLEMIDSVKNDALNKKYCEGQKDLVDVLNKKSAKIWKKIKLFKWTITFDGKNYRKSGVGCLKSKTLGEKRQKLLEPIKHSCNRGIGHGFKRISSNSYFKEQ